MTANMAGALQGDLPWLERQRGGDRTWTDGADGVSRAFGDRASIATSDREDDTEALKEAALKSVKPRHREHVIVLPPHAEGEEPFVTDPEHLDRRSQKRLFERIMSRHGDQDNLPLLTRVQERLERVGMQPPTITVRYRDLSVLARMVVTDRSLPTLGKVVRNQAEPALRVLGKAPPRTMFPIIDNASGIIKPGVFTILLGPPGSGKTTYLRTLAGMNRRHTSLKVRADELTYNGRTMDQFVVERSAAYVSQVDNHYGELTVRETFEYSSRFQAAGYKRAVLDEVAVRERQAGITPDPEVDAYMRGTAVAGKGNLIVEVIIRLLGLDVCADTVVGNAMLRGISGGQKKRVTTGEMVVGPIRALFADEISTGLDSNTTYQIMKALRNFCHVTKASIVVGLLQPQPETFDLFDDVVLLSNGKVCYHGPREAVLCFFQGMGFTCPPRRGVADFLQEVTTPSDQHKYWDMKNQRPYRYVSVVMIEGAFKKSQQWQAIEGELAQPFNPETTDGRALATKKYGATYMNMLRTNFRRTLTLQKRNKIFAIIRTFQVTLMAFVVSTLFWRADKNTVQDGNLFFGVLFYSILYMLLGAISEMHLLVDRLSVFFKQRNMNFYPGWCFAIPTFLLRVPWSFLEATIWTSMVYWIVGFNPGVRFLMFWLQLFLINIWSVGLFQLIAAVTRDDTIATSVGSFFLLLFINLTGFVLNKNNIPPWWIWGYWPNPFAWVTRAVAINEFTSSSWDKPDPTSPGTTLGINVLQFRGFPTEYWWCWASVGFVVGTLILVQLLFIATCTFIGPPRERRTLTPEALHEFQLSRKELMTPQTSMTEPAAPQNPDAAERGAVAWPSAATPFNTTEDGVLTGGRVTATPLSNGGQPDYNGSHAVQAAATHTSPPDTKGKQVLPPSEPGIKGEYGYTGPGNTQQTHRTLAAERGPFEVAAQAGRPSVDVGDPASPRRAFVLRSSQRQSQASEQSHQYRQRTAIPFDPLTLTFRNVEYSVPLPPDADRERADVPSEGPHAGNLRLLKGIDGVFRQHVLTALMGASGAGKTTLMDCLADRKTTGLITGDIRLNGFPKEPRTFARVMGYVEQTDIHMPQTTVEEALHFSARLRLPTSVDTETRQSFVEEILALVELDRLRHAYVGVPGVSGLSVEQRKRLTLAVELVANPSIVFMDEPTSGLDARAAGIVMDAVRATVDTGRTVVCTIHQPSVDIFEAFDELLLLKPGGATIYFGPLGDDSQRLIDYFQGIKGVRPIPNNYNPANWMLEVTNPAAEDALGINFADVYRSSELAKEMDGIIRENEEPKPGTHALDYSELQVSGFKEQFLVNLKRNFTVYNRAPEYNVTRAVVTVLIAFVFGTMFWRQGDNRSTVAGVLNIAGVLFASTLFLGISNCLSIQHLIAAQRTVFYRERAAGLYSVAPFALAQQIVEIPYIVAQTIVYSAIVYWMVWFARDAGKFFWFTFYFGLTLWYFTTLGIAAVNLTPSVPLSNILCSFFFGFWNLLSGFIIPIPNMPGYWVWTAWLNPVMWSIYSLVVTQLCGFDNEYIADFNNVVKTIPQFIADYFQYQCYMKGIIVAIMFAYILAFSSIAMISLKLLNYQRR